MAGLNFVGNAAYQSVKPDRENVAQFEFISWVLSQWASMTEVRELFSRMNLTGSPFSEQLPAAGRHGEPGAADLHPDRPVPPCGDPGRAADAAGHRGHRAVHRHGRGRQRHHLRAHEGGDARGLDRPRLGGERV